MSVISTAQFADTRLERLYIYMSTPHLGSSHLSLKSTRKRKSSYTRGSVHFEVMAQRTEDKTEFEVAPETISLCVKCGVSSSSAANNLCQKCFNATATPSVSAASPAVVKPLNRVFVKKPYRSISTNIFLSDRNLDSAGTSGDLSQETAPQVKREVNRCNGCRRKVGLTGFRCRCGELFCADHRYSDLHDCTYDYKSAGREAIARDNPVIKAAKIIKI